MNFTSQRGNRYDPSASGKIKIHPIKRWVAKAARLVPKKWRFFLFGLPPLADTLDHRDGPSDLVCLPRGISSWLGAHLNQSGCYLPELTLGAGCFIETRFTLRQRSLPRVRRVKGKLLSLCSEGQVNYFRWLIETLPRLRIVREQNFAFDAVYVCQKHPFHRQSLQLLGCGSIPVIDSESNHFVSASELLVPRFVNEKEAWIVPWLRENCLPLTDPKKAASFPRRIYISRRAATGRRIVNEGGLLEQLRPFGFVSVILEKYDWLDQIALFQQAETIIAPHGAGLSNLVFSSAPAVVIELIAEQYPFTFFPEICRQLKLDHHFVLCPPTDPHRVHMSDLEVDVGEVVRIVKPHSCS